MAESSIEIRVYDRHLPDDLREAARVLARTSFRAPGETAEQATERRDRFASQGAAIKRIVAVRDGEVVGMAVAYRRAVDLRGRSLTLGGIGGVCVVPAYRRQGIATRLTLAALRELELAGCDVAYLCIDLSKPGLPMLYGRAGFVPLSQGHTYLGAAGRRYVDRDGMLAPVRSHALFEAIRRQSEPFDIGRGNW